MLWKGQCMVMPFLPLRDGGGSSCESSAPWLVPWPVERECNRLDDEPLEEDGGTLLMVSALVPDPQQ
jgi:hypothetical protein